MMRINELQVGDRVRINETKHRYRAEILEIYSDGSGTRLLVRPEDLSPAYLTEDGTRDIPARAVLDVQT